MKFGPANMNGSGISGSHVAELGQPGAIEATPLVKARGRQSSAVRYLGGSQRKPRHALRTSYAVVN